MEKRVLKIREIIVERDFEKSQRRIKILWKITKTIPLMKHANPTFTKRSKIKNQSQHFVFFFKTSGPIRKFETF